MDGCKHDALTDNTGSLVPRGFFAGQIARARGDQSQTFAGFGSARDAIQQKLRDDQDNGLLHGILCLINAGLGKKEEAVAEGNRAIELCPISKDAVDGPVALTRLAMAYAWLGDKDAAIERLTGLVRIPRTLVADQKRRPVGDAMPRVVRRTARACDFSEADSCQKPCWSSHTL